MKSVYIITTSHGEETSIDGLYVNKKDVQKLERQLMHVHNIWRKLMEIRRLVPEDSEELVWEMLRDIEEIGSMITGKPYHSCGYPTYYKEMVHE